MTKNLYCVVGESGSGKDMFIGQQKHKSIILIFML